MADVGEYSLYVWNSDDGRWEAMMHRLRLPEAIRMFRKWDLTEYVFIARPDVVDPEVTADHLGYVWRAGSYSWPHQRRRLQRRAA